MPIYRHVLVLLLSLPGSLCTVLPAAEPDSFQSGTAVEVIAVPSIPTSPARLHCGDEIDALEAELEPEPVWADHQADWSVEWRSFSFAHRSGAKTKRYRIVKDGERIVAVIRSGDILLIPQTPADASSELRMPTERHHLDNLIGSSLPTWPFIRKVKTHGSIYATIGEEALPRDRFERGPKHLDYIREQTLPEYSVEARFRFTVDPVFGYRIDGIRELSFSKPPEKPVKLGAGTFTPGCYVPWAYAAIYDRTVYTPSAGGMRGWANNCVNMDHCDNNKTGFDWRDGGFIAYLQREDGWGRCYTRKDGAGPTSKLSVCNAHNDFHISLAVPPLTLADEQGRYPYRYVHRLLHLPPSMNKRIWNQVDLLNRQRRSLLVRLGGIEDFEQNPVPLSEAGRGLIWTARHPEIITGTARSGQQSILIKGRQWPNLPQVSLLPDKTYILEGYYKVVPWTEAQWQAAKDKDAKRRAKLQEQGKDLPPVVDWDRAEAQAYISADYYEWSPYSGKMLERHRTTVAKPGVDDWQHVQLELHSPSWGPFVNIAFHADYCEAYLDDFSLRVKQ